MTRHWKRHCYKCGIEKRWWLPSHWTKELHTQSASRWYCPKCREAGLRWLKRETKEYDKWQKEMVSSIKKESEKSRRIREKVCAICGESLVSSQDKIVWDAQTAVGLLSNRIGSSQLSGEKNVLDHVAYACRSCKTLVCKKCATTNTCSNCGGKEFDIF